MTIGPPSTGAVLMGCWLKLAQGKPLLITGLAEGAADLAMAVREAIEKENRPEPS